jgi:hypothetical protein
VASLRPLANCPNASFISGQLTGMTILRRRVLTDP